MNDIKEISLFPSTTTQLAHPTSSGFGRCSRESGSRRCRFPEVVDAYVIYSRGHGCILDVVHVHDDLVPRAFPSQTCETGCFAEHETHAVVGWSLPVPILPIPVGEDGLKVRMVCENLLGVRGDIGRGRLRLLGVRVR